MNSSSTGSSTFQLCTRSNVGLEIFTFDSRMALRGRELLAASPTTSSAASQSQSTNSTAPSPSQSVDTIKLFHYSSDGNLLGYCNNRSVTIVDAGSLKTLFKLSLPQENSSCLPTKDNSSLLPNQQNSSSLLPTQQNSHSTSSSSHSSTPSPSPLLQTNILDFCFSPSCQYLAILQKHSSSSPIENLRIYRLPSATDAELDDLNAQSMDWWQRGRRRSGGMRGGRGGMRILLSGQQR